MKRRHLDCHGCGVGYGLVSVWDGVKMILSLSRIRVGYGLWVRVWVRVLAGVQKIVLEKGSGWCEMC